MSAHAICQSLSRSTSGAAKTCSASRTQVMLSSRIRSRNLAIEKVTMIPDGVGDPARLEQDVLGLLGPVDRRDHRLDQVVADRAAHAAVREADHVALDADDELGVDVDRSEVVDEHRNAQAVVPVQDAVQERGLACAQEARENGQRDGRGDVVAAPVEAPG